MLYEQTNISTIGVLRKHCDENQISYKLYVIWKLAHSSNDFGQDVL